MVNPGLLNAQKVYDDLLYILDAFDDIWRFGNYSSFRFFFAAPIPFNKLVASQSTSFLASIKKLASVNIFFKTCFCKHFP